MSLSKTYGLLDALYFDDASTDKNANYLIGSGTSIEHQTNKYKVEFGSSTRYCVLRCNSSKNTDLFNLLKGKNVKFRVSLETSSSTSLDVRINTISVTTTSAISSDGTLETNTVAVPSDATQVDFWILGTANKTIYFDDFTVYQI